MLPRYAVVVYWTCILLAPTAAIVAYPRVARPWAYLIAFAILGCGLAVAFHARRRARARMAKAVAGKTDEDA